MSEAMDRAYDIRMQTSIGVRLGHMTVCRRDDEINGYLEILNHKEPFEGTIDADGNCKVAGTIITLMRTIHYVAIGNMTPDSLTLSITDGHHVLDITGTACSS